MISSANILKMSFLVSSDLHVFSMRNPHHSNHCFLLCNVLIWAAFRIFSILFTKVNILFTLWDSWIFKCYVFHQTWGCSSNIFFYLTLSLLFPLGPNYMLDLLVLFHKFVRIFFFPPIFFISLFLRLDTFYWSISKFTLSFVNSNLLLRPWSEF